MTYEINQLQVSVFSKLELPISNVHPDLECQEYFGHNFQLNQYHIKSRKSKITPKKIGQFVTLWKRNPGTKETEPFSYLDYFDFYIIISESEHQSGFFFFPKSILIQKQILTSPSKEGKRGFRVYPNWDIPQNKQAQKTQDWQKQFFIDFSDDHFLTKFEQILNLKD
ncbi:hypothetical protein IQ37_09050 [Chryseobacterium piperi]|uniref:MepB family protein n=1 Tax=Chryseobacterium piperi TaxID=558152 RepID=A0A086BIQ6_9FLAO|nr:MepB family protein [Chryseobacterium piperi]ASW76340.1 hypothetical protein CJF12_02220 [Chryseobacterium piperi]KFF28820.1 hypothetical protein IQ37_09050 [Chryseobacterium piperi]